MYILGVNGGKNSGHIDTHLNLCLKEAEKRGAKVRKLNLAEFDILPIDKVSKNPEDLKYPDNSHDDMSKLYKEVLEADGIIFGTPVNWFSVSSEMKIFLDRLTTLENSGFLLEGKVSGFIVHGNEAGEMNALMELSAITNNMGMLSPPYAMIYFDEHDHKWPEKDIKLLAKNMVGLINMIKKENLTFDYDK